MASDAAVSMNTWPALPLAEWSDTLATVHRWTQIVGKTRLHFAPMQNHWWQTTLYLSPRGLTTSPIPAGERSFEVAFDFIEHRLVIRTSDGARSTFALKPESVAKFFRDYMDAMASLDIHPRIWPVPMELGDTLRFDADSIHTSYDPDAMHRCWRILSQADRIFKQFRAPFLGKSSPSHFWWGAFDLSCTRFSGKPAPPHPGGIPNCPDYVTREGYSHECISVGWWPGSPGGLEEPAFYAYSYPEPPGCAATAIRPDAAYYHQGMHEWILPYEAVRTAADPAAMVLAFCESTYAAAADLAEWDRAALERAT